MPKTSFTAYSDSPLAKLLTEALAAISAIKKKYAHDIDMADTPEKIEAKNLVTLAESITQFAHHTILPKFDRGAKPSIGLMDLKTIRSKFKELQPLFKTLATRERVLTDEVSYQLSRIIFDIWNAESIDEDNFLEEFISRLDSFKPKLFERATPYPGEDLDILFTKIKNKIRKLVPEKLQTPLSVSSLLLRDHIREHLLLESLVPGHPMAYELMETTAKLIAAAPKSLEALIPFFNPEAVVQLSRSGLIGAVLYFGGFVSIRHIKSEDQDAVSYHYERKGSDGNDTIEAEKIYLKSRNHTLHKTLEPALRRYLAVHGEAHRDNALAQEAIHKGKIRLDSMLARTMILQRLRDAIILSLSQDSGSYLDEASRTQEPVILDSVMRQISTAHQRLRAINHRQEELRRKATHYSTATVNDLLHTHGDTDLLSDFNTHYQEGLDVSYGNQPLPPDVVKCIGGEYAAMVSYDPIGQTIQDSITDQLEELSSNESWLKTQLSTRQPLAIMLWQEQCAISLLRITRYKESLTRMDAFSVSDVEANIESLEQALARLSICFEKRIALRQELYDYMQLAHNYIAMASDESLRAAIVAEFSSAMHAAETVFNDLELAQQATRRDQQLLQARLENIKADAFFEESLHSIDPKKFEQLLRDKNTRFDAVQNELRRLKEQQKALEPKLAEQRTKKASLAQREHKIMDDLDAHQTETARLNQAVLIHSETLAKETRGASFEDHETLFEHLCLIKSILVRDKSKNKIPFKEIDALLDSLAEKTGIPGNFSKLLSLLKITNIEHWQTYRKNQEHLFRIKPSHDKFIEMHDLLFAALESKIQQLDTLLHLYQQQQLTETSKTRLEEKLRSIQSEHQRESLKLGAIEDEKEQIALALRDLLDEQEPQLKNEQTVLAQFVAILNEIDPLKQQIDFFAEDDDLTDLPLKIEALRTAVNYLIEKTELASLLIASLKDRSTYQATLSTFQQLIAQINQRITLVAQEKMSCSRTINTPEPIYDQEDEDYDQEAEEIVASLGLHAGFTLEEVDNIPHEDVDFGSVGVENRTVDPRENRLLVLQLFGSMLSDYLNQRNERYSIKDFFTESDKAARTQFITSLQSQLLDYVESSDKRVVLESIQTGINSFPGKNLKALLNNMMVAVLDIEQTEVIDNPDRVEEIRRRLRITNSIYVENLDTLYRHIEDMRVYGEQQRGPHGRAITALAQKLTNDIDNFILNHAQGLPDQATSQAFTKKFTARLHSEDNMMSEQDSNWANIVANISLILLLIPKLIYSKLATGRFSFFFEETKGSQLVRSIEESAQSLATSAA